MRLTGGVISYEEKRNGGAQYENKHCKVELSFIFAEDDVGVPAFLDGIQAEIRARCLAMLGLSKPVASTPIADAIPTVGPAPKTGRSGPRKAVLVPKLPAAVETPPADEPKPPINPAPAPEELDEFGDPVIKEEEWTDAKLSALVGAKVKEVSGPPVRKLLGNYGATQSSKVPKEKRAEFVKLLEALKA